MTVRGLLHAVMSKDEQTALRTLIRIGDILPPSAVEPLCKLLADGVHAEHVARVLGHLRAPGAAPALRMALACADPRVVAQAATSLGYLGDPQAIPDLAYCFRTARFRYSGEEVAQVKTSCAVALALLGDRRIRPDAARLVRMRRRRRHDLEHLLGLAADMMGGDTVYAVERGLKSRSTLYWHHWQYTNEALWLRRLVAYPGPDAVRVWLRHLARSTWLMRQGPIPCPLWLPEAIETAGSLAAPETLAWLRSLVTNPLVDPTFRARAVRVLARRGVGELPELMKAAAAPHLFGDDDLALALVDSIERLDPNGSNLFMLASQGSGAVRRAAAETLLGREGVYDAVL